MRSSLSALPVCRRASPRTRILASAVLIKSLFRASSRTRPFDPALKSLDEAGHVAVIGRDPREPLGIFERRRKLAGIAIEADEREQRVAIGRMARQSLLENRHRLAGAPGGMQRSAVDVGVSRPL